MASTIMNHCVTNSILYPYSMDLGEVDHVILSMTCQQKVSEYDQGMSQSHTADQSTTARGVPEGKIKVRRGWAWEGVSPSHTLGKKIKI